VDSRGRSVHRERGSRHRAKPCVCVAAMGLGRAGRVTSLGFTNRALLLTDRLIQRIFRVGTNPAFAPTGDEGAGSGDGIHQPDITVADPKESELLVSLSEERAQRRRCPCRDSPARLKMRAIARSAGHPKHFVTSRREFGLQARISGRVEIRRGGESVRIVCGHNHEVLGQGAGALRPEVSVRESGGKIRHGDEATMITACRGCNLELPWRKPVEYVGPEGNGSEPPTLPAAWWSLAYFRYGSKSRVEERRITSSFPVRRRR